MPVAAPQWLTRVGVHPLLGFDSALRNRPIAHRGLHSPAVPENSLRAFELAAHYGFPIECDVHLLQDGEVAVFHDFELRRMTGDVRNIADIGLATAKQLKLLPSDETIPLLSELLEIAAGRVPLLIELKRRGVTDGRLEAAVVKLLSEYSGEFALQSFEPTSVIQLRRLRPGWCIGQLTYASVGLPFHWLSKPSFAACEISTLPNKTLQRFYTSGLPLLAWTVCTPSQMALACSYADNFIFNYSPQLEIEGLPKI